MSPEMIRQHLDATITGLRAARDTAARSAQSLRENGAIDVADTLDLLAAQLDGQLAHILQEERQLLSA